MLDGFLDHLASLNNGATNSFATLKPHVKTLLYPQGEAHFHRKLKLEYQNRVQLPNEPTLAYLLDKKRLFDKMQPGQQPTVPDAIDDLYEGLHPNISMLVACIDPKATTLAQAHEHVLKISRAQERHRGKFASTNATGATSSGSGGPSSSSPLAIYGKPLFDEPAITHQVNVDKQPTEDAVHGQVDAIQGQLGAMDAKMSALDIKIHALLDAQQHMPQYGPAQDDDTYGKNRWW